MEPVRGEVANGSAGVAVSLLFAVVHEAPADLRTATELADRQLMSSIDWLKGESDLLNHQRTWVDQSPDGRRLTWKEIKNLASERDIRAIGFVDGESAELDCRSARRAVIYLREVFPNLAGIILVRDQDEHPDRRHGLEQARNAEGIPVPIVIGLAVVEREAWVIAGYDPIDETEQLAFTEERRTLGFDPRHRSEELTACKDDTAKRSPKRVLNALLCGDFERERRCWTETLLEVLAARGGKNGLQAFLLEIQTRLAPLIGYVPAE